ncbi:hypothetical protein [Niveibacterium terrae]
MALGILIAGLVFALGVLIGAARFTQALRDLDFMLRRGWGE